MVNPVALPARLAGESAPVVVRRLRTNVVAAALIAVLLVALASSGWHGGGATALGFLAALTLAVLQTVTGVAWLMWFHQAYEAVAMAGQARYPSAYTWLWAWLVPLVELVLPKLLVNDIWRAPDAFGEYVPPPRAIRLWWCCWVSLLVVASFSTTNPWTGALCAGLVAVTGALAIRTVRLLTDRVALLAARTEAPLLAGIAS